MKHEKPVFYRGSYSPGCGLCQGPGSRTCNPRYKGDRTKKGSEGYSHGEILMVKCSEMARNTTNTFSLITNSNISFILLAISIS